MGRLAVAGTGGSVPEAADLFATPPTDLLLHQTPQGRHQPPTHLKERNRGFSCIGTVLVYCFLRQDGHQAGNDFRSMVLKIII